MSKERVESISTKETVIKLLDAAKFNKRGLIYDEIILDIIEDPDGDGIARELLKHVMDDDFNIREAVANGLMVANIYDKQVLEKSVDEMLQMATTDLEKFPAGRAALFLSKHKRNKDYAHKIEEALQDFKNLVKAEGWREELEKKIPRLKLILKD